MEIVRQEVKPQRDTNKRDSRRKKWWIYGETATGLFTSLKAVERCVVAALVSKHLIFAFQPTGHVFSHKLCVFPIDHAAVFSTLQSSLHVVWAWELSSSIRNSGINYSPSKCVDTFPFPEHEGNAELEELGERLQEERLAWTKGNEQGLTKLYNALKDPATTDASVLALRELHEEVDRAVLRAYGWDDVEVPPYEEHSENDTSPTAEKTRDAQAAFRDEILDRLYALNGERAGG